VSDVHGNLAALEAVLAAAPAYDELWCLGDLVTFGPEPEECIARLHELGAHTVVGNHDVGHARDEDGWTEARLGTTSLTRLAALPEQIRVGEVTLRHTFALELRPPAEEDFGAFAGPLCLIGHTHLPLLYQPEAPAGSPARWLRPPVGEPVPLGRSRAIANPGAVGSSFVDPRLAHALVYDSAAHTLTWLAVPYRVEGVLDRLRALGVPAPMLASQKSYVAGDLPPMKATVERHDAWAAH